MITLNDLNSIFERLLTTPKCLNEEDRKTCPSCKETARVLAVVEQEIKLKKFKIELDKELTPKKKSDAERLQEDSLDRLKRITKNE